MDRPISSPVRVKYKRPHQLPTWELASKDGRGCRPPILEGASSLSQVKDVGSCRTFSLNELASFNEMGPMTTILESGQVKVRDPHHYPLEGACELKGG